jgi:hypothetical protein
MDAYWGLVIGERIAMVWFGTRHKALTAPIPQMLGRRGSVGMTTMMHPDSARSRRSSAVSYHPGPNSPERAAQAMFQQTSSGYTDGSLAQQQLLPIGAQQQQQAFQFTGAQSLAAHNMFNAGLAASELVPDVYRTASAPNMGECEGRMARAAVVGRLRIPDFSGGAEHLFLAL